jgi:thiosulfate/3-mercaptopyruvate sulfurtransferase
MTDDAPTDGAPTTDTRSSISTDAFARRAADPDHTLLDVRPIAAYNGWPLRGEARGGHVPGARSIPLEWTQYMDWIEIPEDKQMAPEAPVTVYGYAPEEVRDMAEKLERLGFTDVSVYDGFVDDWAADPERPLTRMKRYRQLVHPEWLHELIRGGTPDGFDGGDYVVCHAHFDYRADYEKGHIPGAIPLNTNWLESPETWNRRSPDELREVLRRLGIRRDTTVVLYGRFSYPKYEHDYPAQSAGHLGAMRCAAILLYAGVEDVRVLNGGITPWESAGYEVSTEDVEPDPVDDVEIDDLPARPEYMIDLDQAEELLAADDGELVSVRSWEEFIGNRSGYHYIDAKGRIPGAVFGNCGSDAYHMENYRNFDFTTREFEEIARKWEGGGIGPEKRIAFYCGTGWRGSEAFMNAYLMGWPNIAVYDGGWYEWSSTDNPVATGVPEEAGVEAA